MPEAGYAAQLPPPSQHATIALLQHLVSAKRGTTTAGPTTTTATPRGKRMLQEQLNQIGHDPAHKLATSTHTSSRRHTTQQPTSSMLTPLSPSPRVTSPHTTYERERKESLFKMQIRQVDNTDVVALVTRPSVTMLPAVAPAMISSTKTPRTSYRTLMTEVGAANKESQARFSAQEATHAQQITQDVLCRSLAQMKSQQRAMGQQTSEQSHQSRRQSDLQMQLHQTHEMALHRVRHAGKSHHTRAASIVDSFVRPYGHFVLDDVDTFHGALHAADHERNLCKLSTTFQRQEVDSDDGATTSASGPENGVTFQPHPPSAGPAGELSSAHGGAASPRHTNAAITLDLQRHYFQIMSRLHPDRTVPTTHPHQVVLSGREWLDQDEFVQLFCLTFGFSNTEWAAKCFPAFFPSKAHYDKSPRLTLLDFAQKCRMLTTGSDVDKSRFVFSIYDHDRSGTVEVDEVYQTLQSDKEDLWDQVIFSQQLMGLVNPNHDGTMGFEDFRKACQNIPMFFTCFTGPLHLRLSTHPENVKYRLGLNAIRKMWSCGVKESNTSDNHDAIDSSGFKTVISYFFRFARSSAIDQALATRLFQTFASRGDVVYFTEFIAGMSTLIQGTVEERGRMMHAVLDLDRGGTLTKHEIEMILRSRANVLQHQVLLMQFLPAESVLKLATDKGHLGSVRFLHEQGGGKIALQVFEWAARKGHLDIVKDMKSCTRK